ncbi:polysaccharide deacetylase family protein [bacterium]|nr:MAG: polysaccharide deacetylase family protein [bacterium]
MGYLDGVVTLITFDDGVKEDLHSIELLERYGLKGTFFITTNGINNHLSAEDIRHIAEVHEIGSHTINHPRLTEIPLNSARYEITESKRRLENTLKQPVTSFAYPFGFYNKSLGNLVKEAGYTCARIDPPFNTKTDSNPYEIKVTLWADPHPFRRYFTFLKQFRKLDSGLVLMPWILKRWNKLAEKTYDALNRRGYGVFHLLVHSYHIEKRGEWESLEEVFNMLGSKKNMSLTLTEYASRYVVEQ